MSYDVKKTKNKKRKTYYCYRRRESRQPVDPGFTNAEGSRPTLQRWKTKCANHGSNVNQHDALHVQLISADVIICCLVSRNRSSVFWICRVQLLVLLTLLYAIKSWTQNTTCAVISAIAEGQLLLAPQRSRVVHKSLRLRTFNSH